MSGVVDQDDLRGRFFGVLEPELHAVGRQIAPGELNHVHMDPRISGDLAEKNPEVGGIFLMGP